jgi:hypothetical protein
MKLSEFRQATMYLDGDVEMYGVTNGDEPFDSTNRFDVYQVKHHKILHSKVNSEEILVLTINVL